MNDTIYQTILDKLQDYLPAVWDKVLFYAAYTEGNYSIKFYVKNGAEVTSCFQLPGLGQAQLISLFLSLDKDIASERKKLSKKDTWSVMTMIVDSQGDLKVFFDYADISRNSIAYFREWEKKYL